MPTPDSGIRENPESRLQAASGEILLGPLHQLLVHVQAILVDDVDRVLQLRAEVLAFRANGFLELLVGEQRENAERADICSDLHVILGRFFRNSAISVLL